MENVLPGECLRSFVICYESCVLSGNPASKNVILHVNIFFCRFFESGCYRGVLPSIMTHILERTEMKDVFSYRIFTNSDVDQLRESKKFNSSELFVQVCCSMMNFHFTELNKTLFLFSEPSEMYKRLLTDNKTSVKKSLVHLGRERADIPGSVLLVHVVRGDNRKENSDDRYVHV